VEKIATAVALIGASVVVLALTFAVLRALRADLVAQAVVYTVVVGLLGVVGTYLAPVLLSNDRSAQASVAPPGRNDGTGTSVPSPQPTQTPTASTGHEIRATRTSYAGLCMAVDGDTVVTAECTGAKSEQWTTDDAGRIVSSDGRCMDPAGVGGGQPLLVASCTTSDTQKWHFADGRIMSGELCLTIWGPYTTPGTHIQTWNTQQDPTLADEMYWELA
jgi:Ricin-type beta-trefoil lectin domain